MVRSWTRLWRSWEILRARRREAYSILPTLVLCLAIGMTACDPASSAVGSRTSALMPTTTPKIGGTGAVAYPAFPLFDDWRVAYVDGPSGQGDTGQLMAISPTETTPVAGPELLGISPNYSLQPPSVSPNGRLVAIPNTSGLNIVELTGQHRMFTFPLEASYRSIAWSPDSTMLAVAGATWQGVDLIRVSDGSLTKTPAIAAGTLSDIIGWVDDTHVVGYFDPAQAGGASATATPPHSDVNPPPGAQTLTLATEDVTSGVVHKVASITSSTMGQSQFVSSPDGKFALYSNRLFRSYPYVPDVRLIDVSTGTVTPLPNIAHAMGSYSGFTSIAWQDGTMTVAASTGLRANGDLKTWLLDISHDFAQPLPYQAYAAGWVPAGGPLILTSEQIYVIDGGPYQITAVANVSDGHGRATVLTTNAYTFPFVGFVRTS